MVLLLSVSCTQDVIEGVRVKLIPSELYGGVEQTLQTKAEAGYYDYVPNVGLTMGVYAAGGSNETVQVTKFFRLSFLYQLFEFALLNAYPQVSLIRSVQLPYYPSIHFQ